MKIAKHDCYGEEDVGGASVRRFIKGGDPVPPNIAVDSADVVERQSAGAEPVVEVPDPPDDSPYKQRPVEDLEAEVDRRRAAGREIEVNGTGSDGKVVKADLVAALDADDEAIA